MPLILAIEPDRRQANQLNAMVRGRLQAELVLADSAEGAFAALGDRVPDLILTSALLSSNDEVVLDERLRALDAAASHVQTLTIPMLAAPRSRVRERAGGVLSALRREKPRDTAPDGCDPAVFAAQCAEYLERARTERDLAASAAATRADDAVAEPIADEPFASEPDVAETFIHHPDVQQAIASEPSVQEAPVQALPARAKGAGRRPRLPVRESAAIHTVSQAIASMSHLFDDQLEESRQEEPVQEQLVQEQPVQEQMVHEQIVQEPAPVEPELTAGMIELDLSTILEDDADGVADAADVADEPEFYDLAMPIDTDDGTVEAEFVAALAEPTAPIRIEAGASDRKTRAWPTIEEAYAEARAAGTRTDTVRPISTRPTASGNAGSSRHGKPVQDEWGFFDPEQCGFAALIAKLDEIIETTDDAPLPAAARR